MLIVRDVNLKTLNGKEYKFPRILHSILKESVNRNKYEFDNPIIITGGVGAGKSNLLFGLCGTYEEQFYSREFSLKDIEFRVEQVIKKTNLNNNVTKAIGFDEAVQGGSGRDSMTKIGNAFRKIMITKRFKQHLLALCVDNIKELNDKILERCFVWIHVHYYRSITGEYKKGYFKIFNNNDAVQVWTDLKQKKYNEITKHPIWKRKRSIFKSYDYSNLWFTKAEYNKKKSRETELAEALDDKILEQRNRAIMLCLKLKAKQQKVATEVGLSRSTIADIKSKMSSLEIYNNKDKEVSNEK